MSSSLSVQSQVEALFVEYRLPLGRYARMMVDASAVDDVVSEAFVLALTKWREVPENAVGWLFTTVQFLCRNQQRKSKRQSALALTDFVEVAVHDVEIDPDRLTADEILAALGLLSDTDRELLVLAGVEGLEPDAIAGMYAISTNAFYVRIHRARGRFKALLETNFRESDRLEVTPWKN